MNNSMISVIIPTYRRPQMLTEALQAIKKQDYPNIEIIVVDDNSWEETRAVAELFPDVVFLSNDENRGPGYSRKRGFEDSLGKYIVFHDDDDYYTDSSFFTKAISIMEQNSEITFVSANAEIFDVPSNTTKEHLLGTSGLIKAVKYLEEFNRTIPGPLSTFATVFSRNQLVKAGLGEMQMINDTALYFRALTMGWVYLLEDTVGVYRVHGESISQKMSSDFVIQNLSEKLPVYNIVVENNLFKDADQWWARHRDITVGYYIYASHPSLMDWLRVRNWCLDHSDDKQAVKDLFAKYRDYLIDYRICAIKRGIKKVLGLK